jgi:phosphatidate phosphatase APP1
MHLQVYPAYLHKKQVYLRGKVFRRSLKPIQDSTSALSTSLGIVRRFFKRGRKGVSVTVTYGKQTKVVRTDSSGYFRAYFQTASTDACTVTYKKEVRSVPVYLDTKQTYVVSDVDDTFLVSHATHIWKRLVTVLFQNPFKRVPVEGMKNVYTQTSAQILYVSNSQWPLFDILESFRKHQGFPPGPFLLKSTTKYERISSLLQNYTGNFYLVGDDGQKDPEIYCALYKKYAGRIKGICIRHIVGKSREKDVKQMLSGTPYVATRNTLDFLEVLP